MQQAFRAVLAAACLAYLRPVLAADPTRSEEKALVEPEAEARYVTDAEKGVDPKVAFLLPLATKAAIITGVVLLFREFALGVEQRLYPEESEGQGDSEGKERLDSYTYYLPESDDYNSLTYEEAYGGRPSQRRVARDTAVPFLARILSSIDPVEVTFTMMRLHDMTCRKRTVCELQRSASRMPIIGSLLHSISPSIRGLEVYREAQEAGAALEDCALLYSECPSTAHPSPEQ